MVYAPFFLNLVLSLYTLAAGILEVVFNEKYNIIKFKDMCLLQLNHVKDVNVKKSFHVFTSTDIIEIDLYILNLLVPFYISLYIYIQLTAI